MIDLGQKVIFTAGSRQARAELSIGQCTAQCRYATHQPEHHQHKRRLDINELKTKAGENTGANHVGDNNGNCRPGCELVSRHQR